jgi:hypothetical protein
MSIIPAIQEVERGWIEEKRKQTKKKVRFKNRNERKKKKR